MLDEEGLQPRKLQSAKDDSRARYRVVAQTCVRGAVETEMQTPQIRQVVQVEVGGRGTEPQGAQSGSQAHESAHRIRDRVRGAQVGFDVQVPDVAAEVRAKKEVPIEDVELVDITADDGEVWAPRWYDVQVNPAV